MTERPSQSNRSEWWAAVWPGVGITSIASKSRPVTPSTRLGSLAPRFRTSATPGEMVAVLVGDEDGADVSRRQARPTVQFLCHLPGVCDGRVGQQAEAVAL